MRTTVFFIFLFTLLVYGQDAKVTTGKLERFQNFNSKFVDPRHIDVWLPEGYSEKEKFAVLYMQDGQMLFDPENTWTKTAWEVDSCAGKLISEKKTRKFIVVGIWNTGQKRHPEYFPQKPYESLTQAQKDTVTAQLRRAARSNDYFNPVSDQYLKFLVTELKPFIDKTFSTKANRKNTFIAGSSMGGLISVYALCEYPEIFGGAACLSTHWPGTFTTENNRVPEAFVAYLNTHLPDPKTHRIYFDYGDQTLDALYPPLQKKVDEVMKARGYTEKNWITRYFPGENHSEKAWSKRLNVPLEFLLTK